MVLASTNWHAEYIDGKLYPFVKNFEAKIRSFKLPYSQD